MAVHEVPFKNNCLVCNGAIKAVYLSLSEIFSLEGRKGGKQAADALIDASHQIKEPKTFTNPFLDEVESSLNIQGHFLNSLVSKASSNIKWTGSDLREGRIPDDLAKQMPMAELVGPDGIFSMTLFVSVYGFRIKTLSMVRDSMQLRKHFSFLMEKLHGQLNRVSQQFKGQIPTSITPPTFFILQKPLTHSSLLHGDGLAT